MNSSFIHGKNCDQLEELFNDKASKFQDPAFLTFDGACFDAHQDSSLIEVVDNVVIPILFTPLMAARMGFDNE